MRGSARYGLLIGLLVLLIGCASDGIVLRDPATRINAGRDTYIEVPADPARGYAFEFLLFIPRGIDRSRNSYLIVEPNNTGTASDYHRVHYQAARKTLEHGFGHYLAAELRQPLLVPVFDRPEQTWQQYTHALDRDSLAADEGRLARIDRQLLAMIDAARGILADQGFPSAEKVLLNGFSASGSFVNRFTALYPEHVQAVAAGGVNAMPILPLKEYAGRRLIYPIGIADLARFHQHCDMATYRAVPQFIYMGANDANDTLPYDDAFSNTERSIIRAVLGESMESRWRHSQELYHNTGMNAQFTTYAGTGHEVTEEIRQDVLDFFQRELPHGITSS
jgi:hypothetical protein